MKQRQVQWKKKLAGWEALVILLTLLVINGAFFAERLMPYSIAISAAVLLLIFYRMLVGGTLIQLNWLTVSCWLVGLSYSWTFFTTMSVENSLLKLVEWFTYGVLLLLIPNNFYQNAHRVIRIFGVVFIVVHFGLLLQIISVQDGLLIAKDGIVIDVRLNGILQYANATGAIAAMLFLYILYAMFTKQKWRYIDLFMLNSLAFLLFTTESRGALLVLVLCLVVGLVVMKGQLQYFFVFASTLLMGMAIYISINAFQMSVFSTLGAVAIIVGTAVALEKSYTKITWSPPRWVLPSGIAVAGIIFLIFARLSIFPAVIQNRLSLATFEARFVYMKDAWQALKEFWLFGAGGEAWKYIAFQYQSTGYVANDLHMFYEQHWLETGIFGLLIVLVFLTFGCVKVIQKSPTLLPILLMLLVHACFDFTLSFGLSIMLLLLIFMEGLGDSIYLRWKNMFSVVPIVGVSVFVLIIALVWQQAENSYARFTQTYQSTELMLAIEKNPYATRYYEALAIIDSPIEAYEKILQNEPRHAKYWFYGAQSYYKAGNKARAVEYFEKALTYDRFDFQKYKQADEVLVEIGTEQAQRLQEKLAVQLQEVKQLATQSKLKNQDRERLQQQQSTILNE